MRLSHPPPLLASALLLHAQTGLLASIDTAFPPLLHATLDDLRSGLDAGHFNSVHLTEAYISRINHVNHKLHAVTEINPDALHIAASLDDVRSTAKRPLGLLHGIPILLSNNIGTADKMNNTAGSTALLGASLQQDSTVAHKLRQAGAILLGKANLSQWSGFRSLVTSNGWSAHGGQTYGAYLPHQDPDGASSGSAVSSSIGLAWASLGTDTVGSICNPAHANNIVGIKPTLGLTSRFLVIPVSQHQDTVGPLARTVKDAAYLLQAIAGPDSQDNYTAAAPLIIPDYVAACQKNALMGKRLGVPKAYKELYSSLSAQASFDQFEKTFDLLREAGAEIVQNVDMPGYAVMDKENRAGIVMDADFLTDLPKYLAHLQTNPNGIHNLADVRAFTDRSPAESSKYDFMRFNIILKRDMTNTMPIWWEYYTRRRYLDNAMGLTGALRNMSLDAVILPTPIASLVALEGAPVVSVPLGRTSDDTRFQRNQFDTLNSMGPNHPFGFAFAGDYFSEEKLIGMAYALEQLTRARETVKPYIEPTTELRHVVAFERAWRCSFR